MSGKRLYDLFAWALERERQNRPNATASYWQPREGTRVIETAAIPPAWPFLHSEDRAMWNRLAELLEEKPEEATA